MAAQIGVIRLAEAERILVEYEDHHWDKREWVRVYKDNFHVFLIEHNMVLAQRPPGPRNIHPAFTFKTLVDNVNMVTKSRNQPVEFLVDGKLDFQVYDKLKIIWDWDASIPNLFLGQNIEDRVREWTDFRDTQHLLISLPAALVGARLKVYRAEGTTQWFDAIMQKYKTDTTEFVMIDDCVLQEHTEDPRLLQMGFLNRQDLESYQKGQSPGSSNRKSRCSLASDLESYQKGQSPGSSNRKSRSSTQRLSLQSLLPSSNLSASMLRSPSSSSISTPHPSKKRSSRSSTTQSMMSSPPESPSLFQNQGEEEEEDTPLAFKKKLKPKRRLQTPTATNPPITSSPKSMTPPATTSQERDQNEPKKYHRQEQQHGNGSRQTAHCCTVPPARTRKGLLPWPQLLLKARALDCSSQLGIHEATSNCSFDDFFSLKYILLFPRTSPTPTTQE
ncbi:hypothetical protein TCAL_16981 [Tigriopus californicus]|uniref:Uncharacterized protein n=1 Tax=Tigriopus californicus TaxID=6832 RepID=A0A553PIF0_TIGCA|nr:hypothetical protein TCAL_16981 [Tigriopus californicus]